MWSHLCASPSIEITSLGVPQQKGPCGKDPLPDYKCPCAGCHPVGSPPWEGPQGRWDQAGTRDQEVEMASQISSSSRTGQGPGAKPGLVEEKSAEQAAIIHIRGKCKVKEGGNLQSAAPQQIWCQGAGTHLHRRGVPS